MKKTRKYIIIGLVAILVLGAAAAVLMLTAPSAEEEGSSTPEVNLEKILDYTIADVKSIDVKEKETGDSYTLIPTKKNEDSEGNDTFTIQGWEDENVVKSDVLSMAQRFYSCSALKNLGKQDDLAQYGLTGDGEYRVDLHLADGDHTLIIGLPGGESSGRYLLYNDTVYIVTESSLLTESKYAFIEADGLVSIPDPSAEDGDGTAVSTLSVMDHFYLSGTNFPEEIRIDRDPDSFMFYVMSAPVYGGGRSSEMDVLIDLLQDVSAKRAVAVKATEEEYAKFGLDEPAAVLDYSINGEQHLFRVGDKSEDGYYAELDDTGVIYSIDAALVEPWALADLSELRDAFVVLPMIVQLQRLTVTGNGSTEVYEMSREVDEDRTTEKNTVYNYFTKLAGKDISYDESFQPFYRDMISIYVMNEEVWEPDGEELLRVKYEFYDETGYDPVEVVFYASDAEERRCVATVDGKLTGIVRRSDVDKMLEAKEIVASGELYEPED